MYVGRHAAVYVYLYACMMYAYMYVYMYIYIYLGKCARVCMYVWICIFIHGCVYTCMCVSDVGICARLYLYIPQQNFIVSGITYFQKSVISGILLFLLWSSVTVMEYYYFSSEIPVFSLL